MSETTAHATTEQPIAGFALSPQQKRLWELQQSSPVLHASCVVEIDGPLDSERLRAATEHVARAHEILTTTFTRQPGSRIPIQSPGAPVSWNSLKTLAPDRHTLFINLDPLCADAATMDIIVRSIASAYESGEQPEAGLSYYQFAAWQNDLIDTPDAILDEARAFWSSQQLHSPAIGHPLRLKIPKSAAFQPDRVSNTIDPALAQKVKEIASSMDLTESQFLFACWCAFLWRWTEKGTGSIGFMSQGRSFDELRDVPGLIARCLPIAQDAAHATTFRAYATELSNRLQQAEEWQDYFLFSPGSMDDGSPGVLDFAFEYEERNPALASAGLTWKIASKDVLVERFELKLGCVRNGECVVADLGFDAGLYEKSDVQRLLDGWIELVKDAAANPDRKIDLLEMIGAEERTELIEGFNNTAHPYADTMCFHEVFHEQALKTPDHIAVRCGEDLLTYRDLDEQSDRLAAHLQSMGVRTEDRVAILMARSQLVVTAILGVMKAGGAYLPLDASYPLERLSQIISDAAPVVILTETESEDSCPQTNAPVILLDEDLPRFPTPKTDHRAPITDPDNLAYVLYTSGSTGRPKGVMVPHRGLVNYLTWSNHAFGMSEGAGTVVDSPIGFDLTLTALLGPLITGQTTVVVPEGEGLEALAHAFQNERDITFVKATPSHLEVLRSLLPPDKAGSARRLIIGGEMLHWESLSFWKQNAPNTILINEYGPTETVVGSSHYEIPADSTQGDSVPIGRPAFNTTLYVLDDNLQLVPKGGIGELYIGGVGVTRGYLNRPDLTADRFVPNPFETESSNHPITQSPRLYKTGDRVKYLPDGNLEYLGRTDHQIKIRGFRIELGEIEAVLRSDSAVEDAVVVVREDSADEKRIVAYLVGEAEVGALRERLRRVLPEYMIPATFVTLDAMPLTPNGKIDRKALPSPGAGAEQELVEPRTPVEEAVAGIWAEVLRREKVGVFDDFFELGGHSLLVIQVIARVREMFDVEVAVRTMFDAPTIASFVELLLADSESRDKIEKLAGLLASLNKLSEEELAARLDKAALT